MHDREIETALRSFAIERRYSDATLSRWLHLPVADAHELLTVARELRLGENQLRELWEWAQDVAERDGVGLAQVLVSKTVAAARQRGLGRNDKLKLLKGALRRLRFPQLAAVEDRLAALVRQLDLPRNVHVTLPPFLEGDAVRVEIVAENAAALRAAMACLQQAAATPACEELFTLLGEAP